jgi:transposase
VNEPAKYYAGVDWGSESHCVWLTDSDGRRLADRSFKHGGEGLAEMANWLLKTARVNDPAEINVAIEVPHGPVVETLLERGFTVWALNPKQMDRFRDRFSVAGAKDDRRDALVMASALRTDTPRFRKLALTDPLIIELREWSRIQDDLVAERTALVNRLRQQLWRYFPAFLDLEADLAANWTLELWHAAPTPDRAKRIRGASIEAILKRHRIRRLNAAQVLEILRQRPLALAPGTAKAAQAHADLLVDRLRVTNRQIADARHQLDALTEKLSQDAGPGQSMQRDVVILASLPGIGRTNLATLLAEASEALQRRDYHALRNLTGVAPVTRRSGRSRIIVRRYACHPRLANAAYHWANTAMQHDPISGAKYSALRARGHSHGRALRSVADRLLNVACSMLRSGTTFNPSPQPENAH